MHLRRNIKSAKLFTIYIKLPTNIYIASSFFQMDKEQYKWQDRRFPEGAPAYADKSSVVMCSLLQRAVEASFCSRIHRKVSSYKSVTNLIIFYASITKCIENRHKNNLWTRCLFPFLIIFFIECSG